MPFLHSQHHGKGHLGGGGVQSENFAPTNSNSLTQLGYPTAWTSSSKPASPCFLLYHKRQTEGHRRRGSQ